MFDAAADGRARDDPGGGHKAAVGRAVEDHVIAAIAIASDPQGASASGLQAIEAVGVEERELARAPVSSEWDAEARIAQAVIRRDCSQPGGG